MATRLEVLKKSLIKKQKILESKIDNHHADAKSANGQPMNDKRNGGVTLKRWQTQQDSIFSQYDDIEITKNAIEKEQQKIDGMNAARSEFPDVILNLLESGEITQWCKYPHIFFVKGVKKARIIFRSETDMYHKRGVYHKYTSQIPTSEQIDSFGKIFNQIAEVMNNE